MNVELNTEWYDFLAEHMERTGKCPRPMKRAMSSQLSMKWRSLCSRFNQSIRIEPRS